MGIVLSVIGKIFFVILMLLCLCLFLLLLLLFCPIHYQAVLDREAELLVRGRVRWLGAVIWIPFSYRDGDFQYIIRIFGIKFQLGKRRGKKKKEDQGKEGEQKAEEYSDIKQIDHESEEIAPENKIEETETEERQSKEQTDKVYENHEPEKEEPEEKKLTIGERLQKIKELLQKAKGIAGKAKEKTDWTKDAKEFWNEENTKQTVCILKDNVIHLLKKIKPKVFKGYVEFGTGDPCSTGQALGALSVFYAWYGRGVHIVPDFMEKKLIMHLKVKGRLSLITVAICALRIIFSKGWNRFMNEAKELKEAL